MLFVNLLLGFDLNKLMVCGVSFNYYTALGYTIRKEEKSTEGEESTK